MASLWLGACGLALRPGRVRPDYNQPTKVSRQVTCCLVNTSFIRLRSGPVPKFRSVLTPGPPVDTGLSIDYDLATPVGLFRFHPLLFFLGPGLKGQARAFYLGVHQQGCEPTHLTPDPSCRLQSRWLAIEHNKMDQGSSFLTPDHRWPLP